MIIIIIIIFFIIVLMVKKIFRLAVSLLAPICIIIFNMTNWSIINGIREIFKAPPLPTGERIAIDSAIVTIIISILAEFISKNGVISCRIKNRGHQKEYRVPRSDSQRLGNLEVEIEKEFKYPKMATEFFLKKGKMKLIINNSDWTTLEVNANDEEYTMIDTKNSSKQIIVYIQDIHNFYFDLSIISNVTKGRIGELELELKHDNFFKDKLFKLLFDIKLENQKIIFIDEE